MVITTYSKRYGFPSTKKFNGKQFYLVGGSMQYFLGDVKRITTKLRILNINYRVFKFKPILPDRVGGWIIYVNNISVNLNDLREPEELFRNNLKERLELNYPKGFPYG